MGKITQRCTLPWRGEGRRVVTAYLLTWGERVFPHSRASQRVLEDEDVTGDMPNGDLSS